MHEPKLIGRRVKFTWNGQELEGRVIGRHWNREHSTVDVEVPGNPSPYEVPMRACAWGPEIAEVISAFLGCWTSEALSKQQVHVTPVRILHHPKVALDMDYPQARDRLSAMTTAQNAEVICSRCGCRTASERMTIYGDRIVCDCCAEDLSRKAALENMVDVEDDQG